MTDPTDRELIEAIKEALFPYIVEHLCPGHMESEEFIEADESSLEIIAENIATLPALTRLLEREKASQWQDISTAPKDGTVFIGYHPKYDWIGSCRFDSPSDDIPEIGNPQYEFITPVAATHWMPLPEPPAQMEGEL